MLLAKFQDVGILVLKSCSKVLTIYGLCCPFPGGLTNNLALTVQVVSVKMFAQGQGKKTPRGPNFLNKQFFSHSDHLLQFLAHLSRLCVHTFKH